MKRPIDWEIGRRKTNPPQEDDMDKKEVQALIDKSKQKVIDTFKLRE